MPGYKSSAFWVDTANDLDTRFQFDETDEDGLFLFVGQGVDESIYVWRKSGNLEHPKDIAANL